MLYQARWYARAGARASGAEMLHRARWQARANRKRRIIALDCIVQVQVSLSTGSDFAPISWRTAGAV